MYDNALNQDCVCTVLSNVQLMHYKASFSSSQLHDVLPSTDKKILHSETKEKLQNNNNNKSYLTYVMKEALTLGKGLMHDLGLGRGFEKQRIHKQRGSEFG